MDGLLPSVMGGPWNLVAGPLLAFNLTILTLTLLNMWAGGRIGRLFSDHPGVWIVTGIAFAMAPGDRDEDVRPPFLYVGFSAALLLMEQAIRIARDDHRSSPFLIGGLFFLAYFAAFISSCSGRLRSSCSFSWRRTTSRNSVGAWCAFGLAALIVFVLFFRSRSRVSHAIREEKAAGESRC